MTKRAVIDELRNSNGLTKQEAEIELERVTTAIRKVIEGAGAGRVKLDPLGTFTMKYRAARKGRNPKTGEEITISGRHVIGFKQTGER